MTNPFCPLDDVFKDDLLDQDEVKAIRARCEADNLDFTKIEILALCDTIEQNEKILRRRIELAYRNKERMELQLRCQIDDQRKECITLHRQLDDQRRECITLLRANHLYDRMNNLERKQMNHLLCERLDRLFHPVMTVTPENSSSRNQKEPESDRKTMGAYYRVPSVIKEP